MYTDRFDKNNYEFNAENETGIYLIHGFSSSTYEMKSLAKFLDSKKIHVILNNLPGHGTTIEECNRVQFSDWLDATKKDLAILSSQSKKIYIIGCSMGGLIALYLASIFPVNGVIVGGLVMQFKKPFMTNVVNTLFCRILKTSDKKNNFDPNIRKKINFYGYDKYPLIALNEFRKMIKFIKPKLKNIKSPILLIHSYSDLTSIEENVFLAKKLINNNLLEIFTVNDAHHNLFDINPNQKQIFKKISEFLDIDSKR